MLQADEGYFFGIGAFETIAVEHGRPVFLEEHLMRLMRAMDFLKLPVATEKIIRKVEEALEKPELQKGRRVLKIAVSEKNIVVSLRENHYAAKDYARGFLTDYSPVRRNETSGFTYHKTLNYGDCLFEKRRAKEQGIDEPVFLNGRGQLCEGAVSNLFFVKGGSIVTPPVSCGLLPGILRKYILDNYPVTERVILPQETETFDEMFVSNSLLGVMPVRKLGKQEFFSRETADRLQKDYMELCAK